MVFSFIPSSGPIWTRTVKLLSSHPRRNDRALVEDKMEVSQLHPFKVKYINIHDSDRVKRVHGPSSSPCRNHMEFKATDWFCLIETNVGFWCKGEKWREPGENNWHFKSQCGKANLQQQKPLPEHRSRISQLLCGVSLSTDISRLRRDWIFSKKWSQLSQQN